MEKRDRSSSSSSKSGEEEEDEEGAPKKRGRPAAKGAGKHTVKGFTEPEVCKHREMYSIFGAIFIFLELFFIIDSYKYFWKNFFSLFLTHFM